MLGSPYLSTPDMQSSVFPDRLIRPLPRRSLRSRLSEEAAEAIPFPSNPSRATIPSQSEYRESAEARNESTVVLQPDRDYYDRALQFDRQHYPRLRQTPDRAHGHELLSHRQPQRFDDEQASGDEDGQLRYPASRSRSYGSHRQSSRSSRNSRLMPSSRLNYAGLDGYDTFENTNNKKKRKVPTHGSIGFHQSSLSAELAHLGLGNSVADGMAMAQDHGMPRSPYQDFPPSAGDFPSATSRARQGRDVGRRSDGRSPLRVSSTNPTVWSTNAASSAGQEDGDAADYGYPSTKHANGTSALRRSGLVGQENYEMSGQGSKTSAAHTKFTFTCETEAAKGVTFPEQSLYSAGYAQRAGPMVAGGGVNGLGDSGHEAYSPSGLQYPAATGSASAGQSTGAGVKPRRRRSDLYALSARQRRLQQEYTNLHHPPAPEEIWICEFCEYESIFDVPPMALIRQYEIKDRKERKRLAEKRRLLEKAKMKCRKGKKQSKQAAKSANSGQAAGLNAHGYEAQTIDPLGGDDYLDEGYEDETVPLSTPASSAVRATMPGAYDATMGRYPAGGVRGQEAGGEWLDGPT